jgi:hypothetical protein
MYTYTSLVATAYSVQYGLCTYVASASQALCCRSCPIVLWIVLQGQLSHLNSCKVTVTKFKPLTQSVQFRAGPLTKSAVWVIGYTFKICVMFNGVRGHAVVQLVEALL